MCVGVTCSTGGLCSVVVAVTEVWTVDPCLIMVVGVTGRARRDVPGACRTAQDVNILSLIFNLFSFYCPHSFMSLMQNYKQVQWNQSTLRMIFTVQWPCWQRAHETCHRNVTNSARIIRLWDRKSVSLFNLSQEIQFVVFFSVDSSPDKNAGY